MTATFIETSNPNFKHRKGQVGEVYLAYGMIFFTGGRSLFKTSSVKKMSYKNRDEAKRTCDMVVTTLNSVYVFLIDIDSEGEILLNKDKGAGDE